MKPFILDLDHCLIFASYSELKDHELIDKRDYHFLYHRPHLKSFLKFLVKSKYDLIFYTSSKKKYAQWVVKSFELEKNYPIFSRFYTSKKSTQFGEHYIKSLEKINLQSKKPIPVLDDRPDLWIEDGVNLIPIEPWHGESDDKALLNYMLTTLKKQPKIGL